VIGKVPNILVIGDLMVDHYIWGSCDRISPEAPVQVVDVNKEENLLGGAGNVMNNLLTLGATVGVCSVIGDDLSGDFISQRVGQRGIRKEGFITQKGRVTTKKSRIMALKQQIVRVDKENREDISQSSQDGILLRAGIILDFYDLILLSDYAKGVLTPDLTQKIILLANEKNKKVLVDPKGSDYSKYKGATLITPNKKEATLATGIDIVDNDSLKRAGELLRADLELEQVIITLSEDGIALFDENGMRVIPTVAREVYDVTGAGDTVLAALGYAQAQNKSLDESVSFANSAAAVVVAKIGSATVSCEEISEYERGLHKGNSNSKIKTISDLSLPSGKKIVFTNGCFDILHSGHVKYLQEAKSFGDILVVGLNSDESVKRLKGKSRPINNQEDRSIVLSGLQSVDFVVIFDEDTPYNLIKEIEPDILVKGGDYKGKEVVGSDIAKETRLVDFVEGKSTSGIIEMVNLNFK